MKTSKLVLAFLIFGFIGQLLYYFPNLPDRMASHFNGAGEPDNWMSKSSFFIFEAVILILIVAEFTVLPFLISRFPASLISLPNKHFWLSEKYRSGTIASIREYFEWFSVGLLVLLIAVNELVIRANLNKQPLPDIIWLVMVSFFVYVGFWLYKFISRFRNTGDI